MEAATGSDGKSVKASFGCKLALAAQREASLLAAKYCCWLKYGSHMAMRIPLFLHLRCLDAGRTGPEGVALFNQGNFWTAWRQGQSSTLLPGCAGPDATPI